MGNPQRTLVDCGHLISNYVRNFTLIFPDKDMQRMVCAAGMIDTEIENCGIGMLLRDKIIEHYGNNNNK